MGHTSTDVLAKPQISTKPKTTPPLQCYRLTESDFNEAFVPHLQWQSYDNEVFNWSLTLDGDKTQYSQEENTFIVHLKGV